MRKKPDRILIVRKQDKRNECEDDRINARADENQKQRN